MRSGEETKSREIQSKTKKKVVVSFAARLPPVSLPPRPPLLIARHVKTKNNPSARPLPTSTPRTSRLYPTSTTPPIRRLPVGGAPPPLHTPPSHPPPSAPARRLHAGVREEPGGEDLESVPEN
jgi:hypothetical protein